MEYKHDLAAWLERKDIIFYYSLIFPDSRVQHCSCATLQAERNDTCVSSTCETVQCVPEALEIMEQYTLMAGDSNKDVLASELVEKLIGRFCGEIQYEIGD